MIRTSSRSPMRRIMIVSILLGLFAAAPGAWAQPFIVEGGRANAQIVVSQDVRRPRMAALGALELQKYLEKISGARLPIVPAPGDAAQVRIYVGQSERTEALGITDEGLEHGAYRIVSGDDWLVLLGHDRDFQPPDPSALTRAQIEAARAEWDKKVGDRTDAAWGFPFTSVFKAWWNPRNYDDLMAENYGQDTKHIWNPRDIEPSNDYQGPGAGDGFWLHDQGGSLNAVYGFLRMQGVRWYMPGELGEVVPKKDDIALPEVDTTVRPDFPLRLWLGHRTKGDDWKGLIWERRIGMDGAFSVIGFGGTHGLAKVITRDAMKKAHPDYYALINGERDTKHRGSGRPCFSSKGLEDEAVEYLRFRFEVYDEPMVQLSPPDGLRQCQCDQCRDVPISGLVFGFLNRIADRVNETHPDHLVLGAAYAQYQNPPESIDQFSPNFAITLNNQGRPLFTRPEHWQRYWAKIESWREKIAPGQLMRVENNRYEASRPVGFPVIHPRALAKDLRALKGVSLGDRNEISRGRKSNFNTPGLSHLTLYANARYLWDAEQDIDALLNEYHRLFYGPVSERMQDAFEYAEANNNRRAGGRAGMDYTAGAGFLDRLLEARAAVNPSIYRDRIDLILEEIVPEENTENPTPLIQRARTYAKKLRQRAETLASRDPDRGFRWWNIGNSKWDEARTAGAIDGKLDEAYWRNRKGFTDENGRASSVSILLSGRWIYLGVRSEIAPGQSLEPATTEDEDPAVLNGTHFEFLLETDIHSFYQIAVNPAGAVYSRDMSKGGDSAAEAWVSQAEAAAHVGDDHWSVEMRLPLARDRGDPIHRVAARRIARKTYPWYFNVLDVRAIDGKTQVTPFIEPENRDWHEPASFAELSR